MIENYNGLVSQHAGGGSWATGALGDGTLRHGAERAIITNIHGLWSQGQGSINDFRNYPAAPEQSRSMMWLGVITAMLYNSLTFQGSFGWAAPTTPGGGWLQEIQQEIWTAQVEQLMPSFTAPFGTVHPVASVASATCLRPSAHSVVNECADPIRVRAWRELCNQTSELCVHVIVVNIALDSPVQFELSIEGLGLTATTNATRLFDAAYNATVSQQGALADYAAPGESLIYEIGCHEAAPKQLSTPTFPNVNDGRPRGTVGVSPWERCMNRRVLCKDGFVAKSPFNATCQPPSHPAMAVHTTLKTGDELLLALPAMKSDDGPELRGIDGVFSSQSKIRINLRSSRPKEKAGVAFPAGIKDTSTPLRILAPFNEAMDKLWTDPVFHNHKAHPLPRFQTHNFGCNVTMLAALHASTGVPGVLSLEACGAIDSIGVWNYASSLERKNQTGLHPMWRANLERWLALALPLFRSKVLVGVFMGDELLCDYTPLSNYTAVGEAVRARLGASVWIYGNECFRPFQDVGEVYSVGPSLPAFLDFISVDWYARCTPGDPGSHGADPSYEVQQLKTFVNASLRPRLLPHQKLLLVPGASNGTV